MMRAILALAVTGLLIVPTAFAQSPTDKRARFVQRVKETIMKVATGSEVKLKVRLRDKTRLKGLLRNAREDSFELVNAESGLVMTVPYREVKTIRGPGVSLGSNFGGMDAAVIGGAVFALALPLILLAANGPK